MIERLRKSKEVEGRGSSRQISESIRPIQAENCLNCHGSLDAWIFSETEEPEMIDDKLSHFSPEEIEKRVSAFVQERLDRWNVS